MAVIEETESSHFPDVQGNWTDLVGRIRSSDESGMTELYRIFAEGVRFFLCQLGSQKIDDKVHDVFVIVVQAIKHGHLREPERLMGFVRTVVRRQVAAYIDRVVHSRRDDEDVSLVELADRRSNPEQRLAFRQKVDLMKEVLRELSQRDRGVLVRYYLDEETPAAICKHMNLTDTQFRLLKSRAKARFADLGKKRLQQAALRSFVTRIRKMNIQ